MNFSSILANVLSNYSEFIPCLFINHAIRRIRSSISYENVRRANSLHTSAKSRDYRYKRLGRPYLYFSRVALHSKGCKKRRAKRRVEKRALDSVRGYSRIGLISTWRDSRRAGELLSCVFLICRVRRSSSLPWRGRNNSRTFSSSSSSGFSRLCMRGRRDSCSTRRSRFSHRFRDNTDVLVRSVRSSSSARVSFVAARMRNDISRMNRRPCGYRTRRTRLYA